MRATSTRAVARFAAFPVHFLALFFGRLRHQPQRASSAIRFLGSRCRSLMPAGFCKQGHRMPHRFVKHASNYNHRYTVSLAYGLQPSARQRMLVPEAARGSSRRTSYEREPNFALPSALRALGAQHAAARVSVRRRVSSLRPARSRAASASDPQGQARLAADPRCAHALRSARTSVVTRARCGARKSNPADARLALRTQPLQQPAAAQACIAPRSPAGPCVWRCRRLRLRLRAARRSAER